MQLIAEKVKKEIEEGVIKVLEGSADLGNIVDSVQEMLYSIETDTIIEIIKELNDIIKKPQKAKVNTMFKN